MESSKKIDSFFPFWTIPDKKLEIFSVILIQDFNLLEIK